MPERVDLSDLPISHHHTEFLDVWKAGSPLLVEAEPGAGKSTLIPLWLLEAASPDQHQVWLVQPRILPARALCQRLAHLRDGKPGQEVGYQVPFDRCASDRTRLLIMTPGILLQRLLADPELPGVGTVILDEVHERSVQQDLAWVWLQELALLRDDLRLILMSATPDPKLQQQLDNRLVAAGRQYPVTTRHQTAGQSEALPNQVIRALQGHDEKSTALVFLPGWRDIEAVTRALRTAWPARRIVRLHSRVDTDEQQAAINPETGPRIIVSTNIAESALTVPDVTLVIDSGLVRRPRFDQGSGVQRLDTQRISQASADQRRGRAGRVQAGQCVRLWSADQALAPVDLPEIRQCDALPLALQIAHWGSPEQELGWLDRPSPLALQQARQQLQAWQLLDHNGQISQAGQQVSQLGTHPRLAALLQGFRRELGSTWPTQAMTLVLWLHFGDQGADDPQASDSASLLKSKAQQLQHNWQWQRLAKRWQRILEVRLSNNNAVSPEALAAAAATAWPDRVAHCQPSGRYHLASGVSVELPMASSEWALILTLARQGKHHRGSGLDLRMQPEQVRQLAQQRQVLEYHKGRWRMTESLQLGERVVEQTNRPVTAQELGPALLEHYQNQPPDQWPWPERTRRLLLRTRIAAEHNLLPLPDLQDDALQANMKDWFEPFLTILDDPTVAPDRLPWHDALCTLIGATAVRQLNQWIPDRYTLPSGREVKVAISEHGQLIVSGKLQEFFGTEDLSTAKDRLPITAQLLSPAGRPLAITSDLASFWREGYHAVAREMRGRYPRHPWPDNPETHPATRATNRALRQADD
ncbi:MAG: ATP-dependent helicase HrpB [Natronospirillum sp.]|uniref:ATP-dependent helicase HrpB n=1 Tax=Natronospirillum sp. TaxID=2812955 RepID=UPI0025F22B48|nr:ATP-dependent helicase HrpB [Natronospirillum sp.]MCH8551188.1 ATP-dependent helicase HrpB [Natronospirillum sp.]